MKVYTIIDIGEEKCENIYSCNDCGAYATEKHLVKHYKTCKDGEHKRWEDHYEKE